MLAGTVTLRSAEACAPSARLMSVLLRLADRIGDEMVRVTSPEKSRRLLSVIVERVVCPALSGEGNAGFETMVKSGPITSTEMPIV